MFRDSTAGGADSVRQAAHSLKSSSAKLRAHQLAALCAELEQRGRSGAIGWIMLNC
jgi:HPt (histidine-containing phosphotransfer) domain-containing protein